MDFAEKKGLHILMIEDDESHAELIKRDFEEKRPQDTILWYKTGEEALQYLERKGAYAGTEDWVRPEVIILDLRLPMMDGLDVLKMIKNSPDLYSIYVIILTTSQREEDIMIAHKELVDAYFHKPLNMNEFNDLMKSIGYQ